MTSLPEIKDLDSLLEKHFQKKIKILDQQKKLLTAPGENYGSVMLALTLKIEDENKDKQDLDLVAKLIPINDMLREMFQVQITFKKELKVYTKIVPTLAELEDEYGIIEDRASDLMAKCYGGRSNIKGEEGVVDEDSVLLLENLKTIGFETGDRLKGFDYESAVFILKNLAKFHATPIALKKLKPEIYKETIAETLNLELTFGGMLQEKVTAFVNGIETIISVNKKYEEKVKKSVKDMAIKFKTTFYPTADPKNPFVTMGHADFWVNNMMLKRDKDGKPIKLIIVDFQTPQNSTLVSDLLFFIYSSVSSSVLYEKDDELIKIYYDSFIARLREFNLDLDDFSWDAFTEEIKTNALTILSQILMMYKPILLERGSIEDMNNFKEDDLFGLDGISDHCKYCMRKTFEQFVDKGWI